MERSLQYVSRATLQYGERVLRVGKFVFGAEPRLPELDAWMAQGMPGLVCRRCGTSFFICRSCWHGQAYCSESCRVVELTTSTREAGRRYQSGDEGRERHLQRQRRYRERQSCATVSMAPVTHQGTHLDPAPVDPATDLELLAENMAAKLSVRLVTQAQRPCCALYGRSIDIIPGSPELRSIRRLETRKRRPP